MNSMHLRPNLNWFKFFSYFFTHFYKETAQGLFKWVHYLPKIARLKFFSAGFSDNYEPNKAERGSGIITMVNTKASRHLNGPYFYSHYKGGGQKRWQNLSRFGHISSRLRPNQCCKEIDLSIFTALDGATGGSSGKKVKTEKKTKIAKM